ncbi:MAG: cytochrome c biogenesis protein CcsA [Planctomycetota bacterium]|jgi:cytochrome c-type biogenesis protein CcsB
MAVAEAILFWTALSLYVAAGIASAAALVFRKERGYLVATVAVAAGLLPHTAAFVVRWIGTGRPPFINLFELLHSGAWAVAAAFVVAQRASRGVRALGIAVMPVAFLTMGLAQTLSAAANPLTAQLRSWWLAVHILFASLAYGCFAVSFGAAVLYLYKHFAGERGPAARLPKPSRLDEVSLKSVHFGLICDTVMILSGSIWANNAWGRFWGWDPVETWSLVTWLVYGLYAHLRFLKKWKRTHAAWLSIAAFGIVVFSYWGVPHLWKSIHDYTLMSS